MDHILSSVTHSVIAITAFIFFRHVFGSEPSDSRQPVTEDPKSVPRCCPHCRSMRVGTFCSNCGASLG
jgi:hypothetical protein